MNKITIKTIFILLLTITTVFGKKSSYSKIEKFFLNSFNPELSKQDYIDSFDTNTQTIDKNKLKKIIKTKFTEPRKYTTTLLKLFEEDINTQTTENDTIEKNSNNNLSVKTSKKLFNNLEILCGEHKAGAHLLAQIDKTQSYAGQMELAKMLLEPTADIIELNKRQEIIKELTNKNMSQSISKFLTKYKEEEIALLKFFDANEFNKMFSSENYFPNAFWFFNFIFDAIPGLAEGIKVDLLANQINKNSNVLNLLNYFIMYSKADGMYIHWNQGLIKDLKNLFHSDSNKEKELFTSLQQFIWIKTKGYQFSRVILDIKILYYEIKEEKAKYKTVKDAYDKLHKIAKIITSSQEIQNIINSNEILKKHLTCFNEIEKFLDEKKSINNLFKQALNNLKSNTFTPDKAPFLHLYFLRGKILSTAYLIAKTQNNLIQFIKAIGQVDAYLSIANLYKESQANNAKYCFAQYLDQEKSYINIQDFWTPFINANKVVTNSITLGGENNAKCALISGPNAGGKSTILKSIILNALLAQTITIVPASSAILTPFSYIDSYLNITDDISGGNSLFKSEVLRVKDMLSHIQSNGKSLMIGDEMFSGTNPTEGEAASYAIAEYIANLANADNKVIALLASHYQKMTLLEESTHGTFKNYKVTVFVDVQNNKLSYPFTLQAGKSDQNIAIDLLQSEGLDKQIIDSARKIAVS